MVNHSRRGSHCHLSPSHFLHYQSLGRHLRMLHPRRLQEIRMRRLRYHHFLHHQNLRRRLRMLHPRLRLQEIRMRCQHHHHPLLPWLEHPEVAIGSTSSRWPGTHPARWTCTACSGKMEIRPGSPRLSGTKPRTSPTGKRYCDSKKVQSTKARWQRLYATNERRGGTATMKTRSPSKAVVQDDICTACGLECVGLRCTQDHCLSFICTRCNTANPSPLCPGHGGPPLTDDVTLRGLPRRQPVRLHIDAVDPAVAAHVKQSLSGQTVVITHADAAATTKIDILFVVYHTDPAWNASHHTQLINESMGTSSPALVGVFACWYPDQEVEALTALSIAHPGVTFITFRIPDLVLLSKQSEYLRQTAVAAINTIRYPDAPQYMYLSDLCTVSKKEAVIFERGVGPLQVAYNILPRCCCGGKYPFKTSSRWKQDMHDERSIRMWHRRCRGKTVRCLDLLLIDHKAVCE
jgi:hypothetical protein